MKRLTLTLFLLLLLSAGSAFAQSWEQHYADQGFTVQDTTICGRRAVFVVPPKANGRWIARPAFIGAFAQVDDALLGLGWSFGLSGCRDLSLIGKTGVEHHPHSLSPCDTIVHFLTKRPR